MVMGRLGPKPTMHVHRCTHAPVLEPIRSSGHTLTNALRENRDKPQKRCNFFFETKRNEKEGEKERDRKRGQRLQQQQQPPPPPLHDPTPAYRIASTSHRAPSLLGASHCITISTTALGSRVLFLFPFPIPHSPFLIPHPTSPSSRSLRTFYISIRINRAKAHRHKRTRQPCRTSTP